VVPQTRTLPLFTHPPVVETVHGVQFAKLDKFTLLHFGLYWSKIKTDYPKVQVKPALGPIVEQFDLRSRPELGIEIVPEPDLRCWFIDATENHLLQIQRDRFHFNWKKVSGKEKYPQYETLHPRFLTEWEKFLAFLTEEGLTQPEMTQCEVTYVNHLERGKGWKSYSDLDHVFTIVASSEHRKILSDLESWSFDINRVIPDKKGRLHINARPAVRREDGAEIIQLTLTARGKPVANSTQSIIEWLEIGHQWIVNAFTEITTPTMHHLWGRTI
jgi:uncharacterized protein (TIGR04255 family)